MRLLLDTNVLLWSLASPQRLTPAVVAAIEDPANDVLVSVVCAWEIAIKLSTSRLTAPPNVATWLPSQIEARGFAVLPVELRHALHVERLPAHHRDPFDRLLVAQADVDGLTIVTGDRAIADYPVSLLPNW